MRLLLIEDEADLARAVRQTLEEEGFSVDTARDGDEGLSRAMGLDYDAILLDLMLPGVDGWTILRKLRTRKKTPVLVLTARDAVQDRIQGLNLGADDYLTKPFSLDEMVARVRALIRRAADQPSPLVTIGDVVVDTAARVVRKGGEPVHLAAKEYALLELLVLHRGKVVPRQQIYEHIYDEDDDSLSNVVDVYVSNLRRKLGKDFLETRRGQGYIVGAEGT
jgi:two-component system, OmpR family, response regulator